MLILAERLKRISEPQTIKMAKLSRAMKAEGIDLIDLSLGEPDFATPAHIIDAACKAMQEGFTKYPPVAGFPDLREAICQKLKRDNELEYKAENIIVSTGAKQALANLILTLINPGDEAIIPTPYWVTYSALVSLAQGKPVYVPSSFEQDYKITPNQLAAAITPRTKLFIFSSPCNPSGSVYSKEELRGLVEVLEKHEQVAIISDEIYEYINFSGNHESIAKFSTLQDRVAIVNGFSKGFAMTGWRLGYSVAPKDWSQACEQYQAQFTSGANAITQKAAVVALQADLKPTRAMVEQYKNRRDYVYDRLNQMPGIRSNLPPGAFYMFPDVSALFGKQHNGNVLLNSDDVSMYLLHEGHLTTVAGHAFGNDRCIRISTAASMEKLEKGMNNMEAALLKLQ